MNTHETATTTEAKRETEAIEVLDCLDTLKTQISNVLLSERKRRGMKKKEFIRLIGVSFPTFKKLLTDPQSQSLVMIEKVFKKLSMHGNNQAPKKQLSMSALRGGFMMPGMQKSCNAPVTVPMLYSPYRMGIMQCN